MARRPIIILALFAALLAGCATDSTGAADTATGATEEESPAAAAAEPSSSASDATCAELADELVTQLQTIGNAIADLSPAEIAQDDQVTEAESRIDDISQQAQASDCQDEVQDAVAQVEALQSEGPSSEFLQDLLESAGFNVNS
jgi:type IV pilus biogenesis protein CpaD/CtpE